MNIKELRIMTGQTQKQFAENFGIPVGTLRRWEYGESTPAPYVIKLIADKIPAKNEFMKKIESSEGTFYFDESTGTIADVRGTRIKINEDILCFMRKIYLKLIMRLLKSLIVIVD